jgi:hypothetical protein
MSGVIWRKQRNAAEKGADNGGADNGAASI